MSEQAAVAFVVAALWIGMGSGVLLGQRNSNRRLLGASVLCGIGVVCMLVGYKL